MHFIVFVNIRRRDCHKGWTKNIKLQTLVHIVAIGGFHMFLTVRHSKQFAIKIYDFKTRGYIF